MGVARDQEHYSGDGHAEQHARYYTHHHHMQKVLDYPIPCATHFKLHSVDRRQSASKLFQPAQVAQRGRDGVKALSNPGKIMTVHLASDLLCEFDF
jgi:hypothetical protein